jgi:hypothetical protein
MKIKIFIFCFLTFLFLTSSISLSFDFYSTSDLKVATSTLTKIGEVLKSLPKKIAQSIVNFVKLVWEKRGEILHTLKVGIEKSWEILLIIYGTIWEFVKKCVLFIWGWIENNILK